MSLQGIDQDKEDAAKTFANTLDSTIGYFPYEGYRPELLKKRVVNTQYAVSIGKNKVYVNGDGTGTKPELAERLFNKRGYFSHFENPASDVVAMVADDAARFGYFVAGILNSLDVNTAEEPRFVNALATGMADACKKGGFALLNGETAELGYRCPGWGKYRLNWNAGALTIINEDKLITGEKLAPDQVIVAFQENSIRSNGLTKARAIMERAYMIETTGLTDRREFIARSTRREVEKTFSGPGFENIDDKLIEKILSSTPMGSYLWEQIQVPWHLGHPELTNKLITPSTIYAPVIREALGGVDGEIQVPIIACAHISGGGVPKKVGRMLEGTGVGCDIDTVFPDPQGIEELIALAAKYPAADGSLLVNERTACEQWNRGIGFLCVVQDKAAASALIDLAKSLGINAAIAGKTTDKPAINWRNETW